MEQRDAMKSTFLRLCQQYEVTGKMLVAAAHAVGQKDEAALLEFLRGLVEQHNEIKNSLVSMSDLLSPYLNGEQVLSPPINFTPVLKEESPN